MSKPDFHIRTMTATEVQEVAIEWAAREGWNPGLHDAQCYYQADPEGFFVGLLNGEPIACISAVAYDKRFAFIGFYIVKPPYRGQGYGIKIWKWAFQYLQEQNVALDGVIEQQESYRKSGFKLAYSNLRFEGRAMPLAHQQANIHPIYNTALSDIIQYDSQYFPTSRPQFLRCWVQQPNSMGYVALNGNAIVGYTVIRQCRDGYKIGPLFAEDSDCAEALFRSALNAVPENSKVYLDIPELNQAALQMAHKFKMQKVFGTARMYTGPEPEINQAKVFGVTSFELG